MTTSNPPLTGKVALVTAASSGIGEATALALAEAGASVALGARRADKLDALATNIDAVGVTSLGMPGLVEQGSGHIINISSVAGRVARSGAGVYNASKWAVNAFSESASGGDRPGRPPPPPSPTGVAVNEILIRPTDQTQP